MSKKGGVVDPSADFGAQSLYANPITTKLIDTGKDSENEEEDFLGRNKRKQCREDTEVEDQESAEIKSVRGILSRCLNQIQSKMP